MISLALRNLLRERTRLAISVGGIAFAVSLIVLVALEVDGTDAVLYLVGYEPDDPVTGPRHLTSGTADISADEIVVDEVFAR